MRICKTFDWEAAHKLKLPYESKCKNIHGHSYKVSVMLEGPINKNGMVIDFSMLKKWVEGVSFDHKYLNDIMEDDNPTAENLVMYVKYFLEKTRTKEIPNHIKIKKIRVYETATSFAEEEWK